MSSDAELDLSGAERGIWLVKVPKYLSEQWEQVGESGIVGKLRIGKKMGKAEVSFALDSDLAKKKKNPGDLEAPVDHQFQLSSTGRQLLTVFSEASSSGKVAIEGKVVEKGECRPVVTEGYMRLKKQQMQNASKTGRTIVQVTKVANKFKPVSNHATNVEYEARKKEIGKRSRADKDYVLEKLFQAFEKHQYYQLKDLVKLTNQPVTYLKEILKEVANYNLKAPHKCMWELKPEYRHYDKSESS
ncbi:general transcription factor IIF subunit 2-like [Anneissia japonica]|uniref:general transcription factor IIF subunit 2-like n=1 Tax=Anneissia japonica TaxID=1529436 RepID=UPI001425726A|nr:general transcription factor IIF subunit 2-like [Anneissia japonica]